MAVEIHIPKQPILTLTLIEGGELEANQYFSFIGIFYAAIGNSGHNTAYYQAVQSKASAQASITTTATHRSILIEWGYLDDSGVYQSGIPYPMKYINFRWDYYSQLKADGSIYPLINLNDPAYAGLDEYYDDYSKTPLMADRVWVSSFHSLSTLFRKYDDIGHTWEKTYRYQRSYYCNHPQLSFNPAFLDMPMFTRDKGMLLILVNNVNNTYGAIGEIIQALSNTPAAEGLWFSSKTRDNYLENILSELSILGSIQSLDGQDYLIENASISFISGGFGDKKGVFKNCLLYYTAISRTWEYLQGKYYDCKILRSIVFTGFDYISAAKNTSIWTSSSSITAYTNPRGFVIPAGIQADFRYATDSRHLDDFTFLGGQLVTTVRPAIASPAITNCRFERDIQIADITVMLEYMAGKDVNYTLRAYNCSSNRGYLQLSFFEYYVNRLNSLIYIVKAFYDVTIRTLADSTIILTDILGNTYTGISNSSGLCTIQVLSYTVEYDPDNHDGYYGRVNLRYSWINNYFSKTTDFNPFTISVNQPGFQTTNLTTSILSQKLIEIPLLPTIPPVYIDQKLSADISEDKIKCAITSQRINASVNTINSIDAKLDTTIINSKLESITEIKGEII